MRLVRPFYTVAFVLMAIVFGYNNTNDREPVNWLMIIPAAVFVWTLVRHFRQRFTTMTIQGNKLRYQTGMMSKSTRTMELTRVQDVRVDQTLMQRLVGIGTISIETAGETGQISMANVDQPQSVADYILEAARK